MRYNIDLAEWAALSEQADADQAARLAKEWNEAGKPLLLDAAIARKNSILAKAGNVIDPEIDAIIRAKYNIYFQ